MNILIDIGHPAHVHYFRKLARELSLKGHQVFWSVKDIKVAKQLLSHYGFEFLVLPKKRDGLVAKILIQLKYDGILYWFCRKQKIDLIIGFSITATHISRISKIKSFIFDDDDDEVQPLIAKAVLPYATELLSPSCLEGKRRRKNTVFYPGYHELAYLHPKRFSPDPKVLHEVGLKENEPYFIMRFNVFKAHHDKGISGISLINKLMLIEILKPLGKIFITTERDIEPELKEYALKIAPEKIHSLIAFAKIFIGDSQTMASEAAVLGVPSLRCNSFAGRISYLEEEEKVFGLTYAFLPENFNNLILKLNELLQIPDLASEWQAKRNKMLNTKIDVTAFWVWFIDNYPESRQIPNNSPEFWDQFK